VVSLVRFESLPLRGLGTEDPKPNLRFDTQTPYQLGGRDIRDLDAGGIAIRAGAMDDVIQFKLRNLINVGLRLSW
jgi:hypothetical protein